MTRILFYLNIWSTKKRPWIVRDVRGYGRLYFKAKPMIVRHVEVKEDRPDKCGGNCFSPRYYDITIEQYDIGDRQCHIINVSGGVRWHWYADVICVDGNCESTGNLWRDDVEQILDRIFEAWKRGELQ